jgi:hypothetical protein
MKNSQAVEAIVMEQGSFDFARTSLREVSAALRMTMNAEWGQAEHLPVVMNLTSGNAHFSTLLIQV